MKKIIAVTITAISLLLIASFTLSATILFPYQGGTGLGTAVAGDIGKCIKVSDDSPFVYSFGSCGESETDHGSLSGLLDDDHTQYLLATGTRTGATNQTQTFTSGIIDSTLTAGRVLFAGTAKTLDDDSNLNWDDTNKILKFGAATGNKILLYPTSATAGYGFGIQGGVLQIFADTGQHVGIGTGASGAFNETLYVDGSKIGIKEGGTSPSKYTYLQGGDQTGDITYTLPTSASTGLLKNTAGSPNILSWDTNTYYKSGDNASFGTLGAGGTTVSSLTDSGLTINRVPFAGTAGLLSDDSDLIYNNTIDGLFVGSNTNSTELLSNPGFTGSLGSWTPSGGFSYGSNNAAFSGTVGNVRQTISDITEGWYQYSYKITNYSGTAVHYLSRSSYPFQISPSLTGDGTFTGYFYQVGGNITFYLNVSGNATTLTLDDMSIKKIGLASTTDSAIFSPHFFQNGNLVIDASTIGAQSVNYAASAGIAIAPWVTGTNALYYSTLPVNLSGDYAIGKFSNYDGAVTIQDENNIGIGANSLVWSNANPNSDNYAATIYGTGTQYTDYSAGGLLIMLQNSISSTGNAIDYVNYDGDSTYESVFRVGKNGTTDWYGGYGSGYTTIDSTGISTNQITVNKANLILTDPKLNVMSITNWNEVLILDSVIPKDKKGCSTFFDGEKMIAWNSITGDYWEDDTSCHKSTKIVPIGNRKGLGELKTGVMLDYKTMTYYKIVNKVKVSVSQADAIKKEVK